MEDLGVLIRLAYTRPSSGLNPDLDALYAANELTVVRGIVERNREQLLEAWNAHFRQA